MLSNQLRWGTLLLALAVAALLGPACGEPETCSAYVEANGCPDYSGTYLGQFENVRSTCTDTPLLQGQALVEITGTGNAGVFSSPDLQLRLTDQEGNWTIFTGKLETCVKKDSSGNDVVTYRFELTYTSLDGTARTQSRLMGEFPGTIQVPPNDAFTANYVASRTDSATPGQACTVTATLRTVAD